jgi:adenylosuccinate lyase
MPSPAQASLDFAGYISPFALRYGTAEMRQIWSERTKRLGWRRIWTVLARAQQKYGLVSAAQLSDIEAHEQNLDIDRSLEIETDIRHDLMAELKCFAEQCAVGGGILHLGATSLDIEDNVEVLRMQSALTLILTRLEALLIGMKDRILEWSAVPTNGFSHLQPAEPITVGFRMAQYAQDLVSDLAELRRIKQGLRGKGVRGAVGTAASFIDLFRASGLASTQNQAIALFKEMELFIGEQLELKFHPITNQTYPRKQDLTLVNALSQLAMSISRFAFDLRLLQSAGWGEWHEPAGDAQVSSSAMPSKRNPVDAENINSLARLISAFPQVTWNNAAHALLERTLDDAAARTITIPTAFLAADEMLVRSIRIIAGLQINLPVIAANLEKFSSFTAVERLLMAGTARGADRQQLHEVLRRHCMTAWSHIDEGRHTPLNELLQADAYVLSLIDVDTIRRLTKVDDYDGLANQASLDVVAMIDRALQDTTGPRVST